MHKEVREMSKKIIILICLLMMFFFQVEAVNAHGWGFKKNPNQSIPDIGEYADILKDQFAFYADTKTNKNIYLTFDNGYEAGYTKDILKVLQEENVPAAFFVTGHYVEEEPEIIKQMAKDGHIIGNHSYHHPDFTTLNKSEIKRELQLVEEAVTAITGDSSMKYLRPPRGTFNEQTLNWTEELGYITMFWSLAFKDWETDKQQGSQYAYEQIMDQIHPGAIMLLHTVSEDNAKALQQVIRQLKKEGYQFKSLDDLLWKELLHQEVFDHE